MEKMITIITANYNRIDEMQRLYDSIKAQTHKDYEWIIVDDHSSIEKYFRIKQMVEGDSKVRLLRNKTNRKQAYCRNKAIKLAKGSIITNIDSDDWMPIDRLAIIKESFEREPGCDVLYGGWTKVEEDKETYYDPKPFDSAEFFENNGINNNTAAWKKECNLFYDESFPVGADDYSMWLFAIVKGCKFMTADINMVFWTHNKKCQSVDKSFELEKEAIEVRKFWAKPRISILMPTYNRTTYLKQAIDSVMKQTFKNWELLIIDDGSDLEERQIGEDPIHNKFTIERVDQVKEIIDSYKDNRIRYIKKEHSGLSATLNYGMDRADGDYIAMLDDDDVWLCFHLEMLYRYMIQSNGVAVYGQTTTGEILKDGDSIRVNKFDLCTGIMSKEILLSQNHLTTCSVLFDKEIVYKNGLYFDESLVTHMDWDFWIKLFDYGDFFFIDIKTSAYRMHDNNMLAHKNKLIIGTTKLSSLEDMGKVQMKYIKF